MLFFHLDTPGFEVPSVGIAQTEPGAGIEGPYRYVRHIFPGASCALLCCCWLRCWRAGWRGAVMARGRGLGGSRSEFRCSPPPPAALLWLLAPALEPRCSTAACFPADNDTSYDMNVHYDQDTQEAYLIRR